MTIQRALPGKIRTLNWQLKSNALLVVAPAGGTPLPRTLEAFVARTEVEPISYLGVFLIPHAELTPDTVASCQRSLERGTAQAVLFSPTEPESLPAQGPQRYRVDLGPHGLSLHADPIRVTIVDDSKTMRELLKRAIESDPQFVVVDSIGNPLDVERALQERRPDVVTMDIHMPELDGISLVRRIMPTQPLPIVMISALSREDSDLVLSCLEAGAVDYIEKPRHERLQEGALEIRTKLLAAAEARVAAPARKTTPAAPLRITTRGSTRPRDHLIVIGSSTGGTEALREVLTRLPATIPPVLIVQHIPPVFSRAFAERLNGLCPFEVKEAESGDEVIPNRVIIAPGGKQMRIAPSSEGGYRVQITDDEPVNRHKPSVDYLFDSVARLQPAPKLIAAAILTGMGADGARGLLALRQRGAHTIAQSERTCVVYGMPQAAVKLEAAVRSLDLAEIAGALLNPLGASPERSG